MKHFKNISSCTIPSPEVRVSMKLEKDIYNNWNGIPIQKCSYFPSCNYWQKRRKNIRPLFIKNINVCLWILQRFLKNSVLICFFDKKKSFTKYLVCTLYMENEFEFCLCFRSWRLPWVFSLLGICWELAQVCSVEARLLDYLFISDPGSLLPLG